MGDEVGLHRQAVRRSRDEAAIPGQPREPQAPPQSDPADRERSPDDDCAHAGGNAATLWARSLVFLACFSTNSQGKASSYQNEEVGLAAEQMRRRQPDVPWLIPVRFDSCNLPSFDLGGGRTLDSLQCVDLFGPGYRTQVERLVRAIQQILADEMRASEGHRVAQPPVPAAVRFSLPPGTATFTGREVA